MTPDHFQLSDIKNDFWREFMCDYAERTSFKEAEWLYCELYNQSGGELPYIAYDPIRIARDKAILAGEDIQEHLSPRQKRRIVRRGTRTYVPVGSPT